jgi:hypothetical protein
MNCKEYRELIPSYIKKELEGEKRIFVKSHLKSCPSCQKEYFSQTKIHYTLDRGEILSPDPDISTEFKAVVLERITHSSMEKNIKTKWIWYAAAAILLVGIVIGRFVIPDMVEKMYISDKGEDTLSQLLASEDWNKLEIVLSDQVEFSKYSTDTIPIHILLDKLSSLQKMGIQSLPITNPSDSDRTKNNAKIPDNPQIQISLNDFIRLLEQAKQQRSQITLKEVSNIITKL